jgi:type IV secretion system protein VirD4
MPKGQFIVMKTGFFPMIVKLKLFFKWGITFGKEYTVPDKGNRKVEYASKDDLRDEIFKRFHSQPELEEKPMPDAPESADNPAGIPSGENSEQMKYKSNEPSTSHSSIRTH